MYVSENNDVNNFLIKEDKLFLGADHAIFFMNLDGTNRKALVDEYSGSPLILNKEWLVYNGLYGAYRVNINDCTQNIRISSFGTAFGFFANEKGIFYTNRFGRVDKLIHLSLGEEYDGHNRYTIISEQPGCKHSNTILEDNGWVYFFSDEGLCRISLSGQDMQVLIDYGNEDSVAQSGWMNIQGSILFSSCNLGTYSVNLDDLTYNKIDEAHMRKLNVVGDWIYYAFDGINYAPDHDIPAYKDVFEIIFEAMSQKSHYLKMSGECE